MTKKLNYEDKWKKNDKSLYIKCIRYPIYSKFIKPDMFSHAPGVIPEASKYKSYVHQFLSTDDSNADTAVHFITFTNVPELG